METEKLNNNLLLVKKDNKYGIQFKNFFIIKPVFDFVKEKKGFIYLMMKKAPIMVIYSKEHHCLVIVCNDFYRIVLGDEPLSELKEGKEIDFNNVSLTEIDGKYGVWCDFFMLIEPYYTKYEYDGKRFLYLYNDNEKAIIDTINIKVDVEKNI